MNLLQTENNNPLLRYGTGKFDSSIKDTGCEVTGSIVKVQRLFKSVFGKNTSLSKNTIKNFHDKLINVGYVLREPYKSRALTAGAQDNIEAVKHSCEINSGI